jgi:phospholipase/carboxylesterase
MSRARVAILAVAAPTLIAAATIAGGAAVVVPNPASGLRTWEVGTGERPLVLLHGYSATPQDWLPFAETIRVSPQRRFVFPEAPELTTPPDGPVGGRAWWRLDLASYRHPTSALPDLSRAYPPGLPRAAAQVRQLVHEVEQRLGADPHQLILGGFSQGAMVSAEIAFRSNEPLRALVLLSGTPVDESAWRAAMPTRRGLPVFIAHGRQDDVLRFDTAVSLQQDMRRAGLRVTWMPFDAGHEIPAEVVTALNQFLATID